MDNLNKLRTGGAGGEGGIGPPGRQGEQGPPGETGRISAAAIGGYLILAIGTVFGVWFVGHNSSDQLKNDINGVVTKLCIKNISTIEKENKLRDAQIEFTEDIQKINLREGDYERTRINAQQISALKQAKRHVPTIEECEKPIVP